MRGKQRVAVVGATGYVGGRLTPLLLDRGHMVRAIARSAAKLACRPWGGRDNLEIAAADVLDLASLTTALQGCDAAFYLVHSMSPGKEDFAERDRRAAANMAQAAHAAGLSRIIYLSGLGEDKPGASKHLRSRSECARLLQAGRVPVTVLRAAQILGAGSASFEILRYLADRLPIMITPRWVFTQAQPIAIRDVLHYLAGCLDEPLTTGQSYDIGGPDVLSYRRLFDLYCQEAGLARRWIIPVPFLSPRLSALWVGLVTPLPPALARPLVEGLKTRVVCEDHRLRVLLPTRLTSCREAIRLALDTERQQAVETCWSDAGELREPEWVACGDASYAGGTVLSLGCAVRLAAEPAEVFARVKNLGGRGGYLFGTFLWKLRGWMDKLAGGPGLARGRRSGLELRTGDALDFWRVLDIQENRRLLLLAEMLTPGEALLEFRLEEAAPGETRLIMRSRFLPRGVLGLAYWWILYIPHRWIFAGMLRALARSVGKPLLAGPAMLPPGETETGRCRL